MELRFFNPHMQTVKAQQPPRLKLAEVKAALALD
jgi:hypothetical protein